jgi:hypothetical protein
MAERRATIVVAAQGDTWRVTTDPDSLHAHRHDHIVWTVENTSSRSVSVELADFRFKPSGQLKDPTKESGKHATAPPGRSADIHATVRDDAEKGAYTYQVRVDGRAADPEVVIEDPI